MIKKDEKRENNLDYIFQVEQNALEFMEIFIFSFLNS